MEEYESHLICDFASQIIWVLAVNGVDPSGKDFAAVNPAEFREQTKQLNRMNAIRRNASERNVPVELLRYLTPFVEGDWYSFKKPLLGPVPLIHLPTRRLEDIDNGNIDAVLLGRLYNEAFHSFMHHSGKECSWLTELMLDEARLRFQALESRPLRLIGVRRDYDRSYFQLSGHNLIYTIELEALEEAMSELTDRLVIDFSNTQTSGRRRSATLNDKFPPGHDEQPRDAFYRWPTAKSDISLDLKIATLWIMENGCSDPRSEHTDPNDTRIALQIWYANRWSPTRPRTLRVDRIGRRTSP